MICEMFYTIGIDGTILLENHAHKHIFSIFFVESTKHVQNNTNLYLIPGPKHACIMLTCTFHDAGSCYASSLGTSFRPPAEVAKSTG